MLEIPESTVLARQLNDTVRGKAIRGSMPTLRLIDLPFITVTRRNMALFCAIR
jgi:hypothetical protein